MSADATGWVFRHSPFDGVTFAVHLAMADSVNDQHGQLFWMSVENTSKKARVSERSVQRSLRELEASGLVLRVRYSTQHSPAVYRFQFPDIPVVYDTRSGGDTVSPLDSGVTGAAPRGDTSDTQGRQGDTQTQEIPSEPKRRATNPRAVGTNPRATGTNPRAAEPVRTQPSTAMSKEELEAIDHPPDPVSKDKIRELRESVPPWPDEGIVTIDENTLIYGKPRGHYSEADWTPAREDCPHPEHWTCSDGDSTEHQVTELVAAFVRALQPELVVETGAAFGDTTLAIGDALRRNGHGRLVALEPAHDRADYAAMRCSGLPVIVRRVPSNAWTPDGPIGFAWFDSLPELRVPEFRAYRRWMVPGAIVGFHDCGPHRPVLRAELEALMDAGEIRGIMPRTPRGVLFAEVLQ